jgi:hypothetical protein
MQVDFISAVAGGGITVVTGAITMVTVAIGAATVTDMAARGLRPDTAEATAVAVIGSVILTWFTRRAVSQEVNANRCVRALLLALRTQSLPKLRAGRERF